MLPCPLTLALALCTLAIMDLPTAANAKLGEYCQWETFKAECETGHVIVMRKATYGRMEFGECIEKDYGYLGCSTDVLRLADARCSGRRSCEIRIPDETFDTNHPCPKDLRRYLVADYDCIPVVTRTATECRRSPQASLVPPSGYIGSLVTAESGCGTTETPWRVRAQPGQRINFTLLDFATANTSTADGRGPSHCHVYVILKEATAGRSVTVCGGQGREKAIFTSTSHDVEVRVLTGASANARFFLLKYNVWGCPDVERPKRGWVKHQGTRAYVGCETSDETWELTCNGTVWTGHVPPCDAELSQSLVIGNVTVPYTVSLLIIVGVALMIGVCILTVGLLCLRRQRVLRRGRSRGTPPNGTLKHHPDKQDPYQKVSASDDPYMTHQPETSENEYAYVDDFFPPAPSPHGTTASKLPPPPPPILHNNSAVNGRYQHYKGGRGHLPRVPGCGGAFCSPSAPCEECRESRHYFELDPDVATSCSPGSTVYTHAHSQPLLCAPGEVGGYPGYDRRGEQGTV